MSNHNNNFSWPYSSPHRPQQDGQHHPQAPTAPNGHVVENGRRLLAVYPPVSATPIHHGATHINNFRAPAAPTFPQPTYSGSYPQSYSSSPQQQPIQDNPPPYSEYDSRLQYLAQPQGPSPNDSGFWESSRNDSVRMLNQRAGPSYQYREPPQDEWRPQSSYQSTPFAQTVFQRTAPPSSAYPTPPPALPGMSSSSSSLAFALGPPPSQPRGSQGQAPRQVHAAQNHTPPQPPQSYGGNHDPGPRMPSQPQRAHSYKPQEGRVYFEDFLERKTNQMNEQRHSMQPQLPHPNSFSLSSTSNRSYPTPSHNGSRSEYQHPPYNEPQRPHHSTQPPLQQPSLPSKPAYAPSPHQQVPQHSVRSTPQNHTLPPRPPSASSRPSMRSHQMHYQPVQQAPLPRPPSFEMQNHHPLPQPRPQSLSRQGSLQNHRTPSIFPPVRRPVTPPSKVLPPDSSPDPLALRSGGDGAPEYRDVFASTPVDSGTVTPRKRKPVVEISSPSKRVHLMKSDSAQTIASNGSMSGTESSFPPKTPSTQSTAPMTPSTSRTNLATSRGSSSARSMGSIASIPPSEASVESTPFLKRVVNNAYVAITPRSMMTPRTPASSAKRMRLDSDDLGGYGHDDDDDDGGYEDSMAGSPVKRGGGIHDSAVKGSARRTGDRDSRNPNEKLISLIEDIFEAEDTLPPGSEAECTDELKNNDFFSPLSKDPSRPMLLGDVVRKLSKCIGYVARPGKWATSSAAVNGSVGGTPRTVGGRGKGRMSDVDTQMLSRLLKILERGVKVGEDLDGFPNAPSYGGGLGDTAVRKSPTKKGAKKGGKGSKKESEATPRRSRSRSRTPKDGDDVNMDEDRPSGAATGGRSATPTAEELDKLTEMMDLGRDSILAAECVLALLGSDRLPKQLYSEELITACMNSVKNQLVKILYPFVEASFLFSSGGDVALSTTSPLLLSILKSASSPHRPLLQSLYQGLSAVFPRITNLINAESVAMSENIIISGVYIAIGPFFIADGGDGASDKVGKKDKDAVAVKTLGKNAMRGLRLEALSLIRGIFANHEKQRSWIIEEILTSLIKLNDTKQKAGQFRLRDGRSIRTVSALLLQLVQTSAHDVRIAARKIERARQNKLALKRQESFSESQSRQQEDEPFLDEIHEQELALYSTALESATKAAKTIMVFLTQRSGKGKATKNSNEAEYRAILDNFIEDLLVVLFWPEWPAAGLVLSIAMKFMVQSLNDVKSSSQTDSNAAKQLALDHLGVIAAKIQTSILKFQNDSGRKPLKPLDEIVSSMSLKNLNRLLDAHSDIAAHLCKRSSEDQVCDSARELTAAMFGHELASALKTVSKWIEQPEADEDLDIKDTKKLPEFGGQLKDALKDVWKDPATDVFNVGSQEEAQRIDVLAEELGTVQSLRNSFSHILNVVLGALDAPAIFMRTKALKALGQIITSDASILSASNVRRGIESHLLDSSPQVRDAAVELIGKYMIDTPSVAGNYYPKIADRMADTGLAVRKRVIKLLKNFYAVSGASNQKIDIATRLVLRILDEDETVKDLAIKSIEELWFPPVPLPSAMKSRTQTAPTSNAHDKSALLGKVSVIMGTAAHFKDRQSPLEDVLHKIMKGKNGTEQVSLHSRYGEVCEALIDGLVDASDLPGFTVTNCVRTIYLLTSAYPSVLSGTNASTLLPYLKNPNTSEELIAADYLLKIFRVSIPHMPKTAAKFGQDLQTALQPMVIKPSTVGGMQILQETVGCMCVVVQHLTRDYIRLINLLKSCNGRLQHTVKRPATTELNPTELRTSVILIFIVSLLAEHCDFDSLRKDHAEFVGDLDSISHGSIIEHVYSILLTLYEKYDNSTLRPRILQCLGFLFRAQPTLMTMERSSLIMDQIFASQEEEAKGRLLRMIQEFLVSQAEKHAAVEKESSKIKTKPSNVNMDELVGNTDGFADSGVSSAIIQRYLSHVLEAALSQNAQFQAVAIDVLTFTIKQGLAHPLQSFPAIVALETSNVAAVSNRASALHAILQAKHASLLNARYTLSARESFDYQKKINTDPVQGFRLQPGPVALLQRWYSHIREKRAIRQDFLKSLVKIFQESESLESSQADVDYTRYIAENIASFDYKTLEEVLTVIKLLTNILSTSGTQLLETISPSHLLSHLHGSSEPRAPAQPPTQDSNSDSMVVPQNPPEKTNAKEYDIPALMRTSIIIAMVMLLKAYLKTLYSLSEEKCLKFVLGKKSAIGDKPANKRNDNPISWTRLPFATTPLLTMEDAASQKATFLEIWNEDGVTAEPEDDDFI